MVASNGVGWEWLLAEWGGSGFRLSWVGVAFGGVGWEWLLAEWEWLLVVLGGSDFCGSGVRVLLWSSSGGVAGVGGR